MKKNNAVYTGVEVKKDAKAWIIFGSIYTPISLGIFIIFPIVAQVKDLGVCLALGAFLVLLGPAAIFYGVQKRKEAERLEQQIAMQKPIKNPNSVLFGVDDGAAAEIATKYYCEKFGKSADEITDEDENIIWDWAYDEISYILAWIFENGYYNPEETEEGLAELAEKIAKREAIPSDYMNFDASFFEGNVKDEALDFVNEYLSNSEYIKGHNVAKSGMIIGAYYAEVEAFAKERLNAPLLGFPFTWEDYDAFKGHIDEAFAKYKSRK